MLSTVSLLITIVAVVALETSEPEFWSLEIKQRASLVQNCHIMENFRSQIVLEVRILLPTGLFACCWQDPFLIRILLRTEFTKSNTLQQDQNMKSLEAFIIPTRCNLQSRIKISNPFSPQNGSAIWLSRTQARYMEGALLPPFCVYVFHCFIMSLR